MAKPVYVIVKFDGPRADFVEIEDELGAGVGVTITPYKNGLHRIGPLYLRDVDAESADLTKVARKAFKEAQG